MTNTLINYLQQKGNSLGKKISNAFKKCFSLGNKNVVIIGADCIEITKKEIQEVFNLLSKKIMKLLLVYPSRWRILSARSNTSEVNSLFKGIKWNSNKVLKETINIIEKN